MSWLTDAVDTLSSLMLSGAAAFAVAESGLGVGMFIPGETAVLVAGAALRGSSALFSLFIVVGLASSAGDHIGFFLGRHYGVRLRDTRLVRRLGHEKWDRANDALRRYGGGVPHPARACGAHPHPRRSRYGGRGLPALPAGLADRSLHVVGPLHLRGRPGGRLHRPGRGVHRPRGVAARGRPRRASRGRRPGASAAPEGARRGYRRSPSPAGRRNPHAARNAMMPAIAELLTSAAVTVPRGSGGSMSSGRQRSVHASTVATAGTARCSA